MTSGIESPVRLRCLRNNDDLRDSDMRLSCVLRGRGVLTQRGNVI